MAEQRAQGTTLLVPVLAGLAGAGIALLVAPKSGRETRTELRAKAQEMKRRAQNGYDTATAKLGTVEDEVRGLQDKVAGIIKTGGNRVQHENE